MKTYTEQDLRLAFQAGEDFGRHNAYDSNLLDEDEYIESLNKESTIGFTYGYLKRKFEWDDICAITGLSYYCRAEGFTIEDSEVFQIKESIAKQYNLI